MPGIQTDQNELEVLRYFILEYKNENNDPNFNAGLNYHLDSDDNSKEHVLSCVFTFRSDDCLGGGLNYSNEDSGGSNAIDSQKYEKYNPPDNSMYFLYGSYVKHSVNNVLSGKRYAVVFFLKSLRKIEYIRLHWKKNITFHENGGEK